MRSKIIGENPSVANVLNASMAAPSHVSLMCNQIRAEIMKLNQTPGSESEVAALNQREEFITRDLSLALSTFKLNLLAAAAPGESSVLADFVVRSLYSSKDEKLISLAERLSLNDNPQYRSLAFDVLIASGDPQARDAVLRKLTSEDSLFEKSTVAVAVFYNLIPEHRTSALWAPVVNCARDLLRQCDSTADFSSVPVKTNSFELSVQLRGQDERLNLLHALHHGNDHQKEVAISACHEVVDLAISEQLERLFENNNSTVAHEAARALLSSPANLTASFISALEERIIAGELISTSLSHSLNKLFINTGTLN